MKRIKTRSPNKIKRYIQSIPLKCGVDPHTAPPNVNSTEFNRSSVMCQKSCVRCKSLRNISPYALVVIPQKTTAITPEQRQMISDVKNAKYATTIVDATWTLFSSCDNRRFKLKSLRNKCSIGQLNNTDNGGG